MIQATIRRDGSSVFGKNNRWGTFPSVSVAWNITEEDFMKHQDVISNLKLRLGYGVSGNALASELIPRMKPTVHRASLLTTARVGVRWRLPRTPILT